MYEAYWGLREPPFDNAPNAKFFYRSPEHDEALMRLVYAVRHRKGGGMLTGEYGCGKTTLSRALIHRLVAERYDVGLLTHPPATPAELLREILYQLGAETSDTARPELRHRVTDLCVRNLHAGRDTVIIVDEAQLIEDDAVFEELRLVMNLQTDERFLATVLLIGSSELVNTVRRLKALDQRIAIRYHLNTLDAAHTGSYVAHRLAMAGRIAPLFTTEAVKLIFDFTRGTPREINNVCDLALLVGASRRVAEIDEKVVAEVIKDIVGLV